VRELPEAEPEKPDFAVAAARYNRFRSPECEARVVEAGGDRIVVDFRGSFCATCAPSEYVEDFVWEVHELLGVRLETIRVEPIGDSTLRAVYGMGSGERL
jgi:hypothetical protein